MCVRLFVYECKRDCVFIQRTDLIEPRDGMPMTQTTAVWRGATRRRHAVPSQGNLPPLGRNGLVLKPKPVFGKECASTLSIYIYKGEYIEI